MLKTINNSDTIALFGIAFNSLIAIIGIIVNAGIAFFIVRTIQNKMTWIQVINATVV